MPGRIEGPLTPSGRRVLCATCDPGGADVVAAVIEELERRSWTSTIWSAGRGSISWMRGGRAVAAPPGAPPGWEDGEVSASWVDKAFATIEADRLPDLVVVSSSDPSRFELDVVAAARSHGVPTVMVLDAFRNAHLRLSQSERADLLLVPDVALCAAFRSAGWDVGSVVATGPLGYDTVRMRRSALEHQTAAWRRQWNPHGAPLILFLSENIRAVHGVRGEGQDLGFDERICVLDVVAAASRMADRHGPMTLLVKLHPKEAMFPASELTGDASRDLLVDVVRGDDPAELMIAADLVVGMYSVALAWSALLGRPALAYQPDRRTGGRQAVISDGVIPLVAERALLENAIERLLFDEGARRMQVESAGRWAAGLGAAAKAADAIEDLAGRRESRRRQSSELQTR